MAAASGESERPARPKEYAKGQRWNWRDMPRWTHITLTRPSPNGWYALDDRGKEDGHFDWSMLAECTYLGPVVPQDGPGVRVMGVRPNGCPAACLRCGGQWDRGNSDYVCRGCCEKYESGGLCTCAPLLREWEAGARDFPRPAPSVTPVAPTAYAPPAPCKQCKAVQCVCKFPPAPARVAPQSLSWDERRTPEGVPMSALQHIASRPKPEPYVCPMDEWDLLPGVDERGWR